MMTKPPKPVAQLVGELGGPDALAGKLNVKPATVKMWAFRGAVPRRVWPELLDAYPDMTLDRLKDVEGRAA
jgi:hypothetical protein